MKKERYVFDTKELASYIASEYKDKTNKSISPIKLQKTLYFCFAYWGGFIKRGQGRISEIDNKIKSFSPYLFEEDFEAWVYGPVVKSLYKVNIEKLEKYKKPSFQDEEQLKAKDLIDSLINEVVGLSDFTLVDIAHRDNCWIKNFNDEDNYHNETISKECIIEEYAGRKETP